MNFSVLYGHVSLLYRLYLETPSLLLKEALQEPLREAFKQPLQES